MKYMNLMIIYNPYTLSLNYNIAKLPTNSNSLTMIFLLVLDRHKVNRGTVTPKEKEVISAWWAFNASFIAILN